jgi:hypothetical protein
MTVFIPVILIFLLKYFQLVYFITVSMVFIYIFYRTLSVKPIVKFSSINNKLEIIVNKESKNTIGANFSLSLLQSIELLINKSELNTKNAVQSYREIYLNFTFSNLSNLKIGPVEDVKEKHIEIIESILNEFFEKNNLNIHIFKKI